MRHNSKPVILVSSLDWGLGHASRMIPVISGLIRKDFEVILGVSGLSGKFLVHCFTHLPSVELPSFTVRYGKGYLFLNLLFKIPLFVISIVKEHLVLKKIIKNYQVKIVISDNRYGLWNRNIYSVLITHQIFIRLPAGIKFIQPLVWLVTRLMIQKFDDCWIPDIENNIECLSGKLSHGKRMPVKYRYIGILSRFTEMEYIDMVVPKDYKLLIILSGPEPQRTVFENIILKELNLLNIKAIILRGLPGEETEIMIDGNIKMLNTADDDTFKTLVSQSEYIICRSGYSTIMDLIRLGRTALIVPTPGQTEQEYLAEYLTFKGMFLSQAQNKFNLTMALDSMENFEKNIPHNNSFTINLLEEALDMLTNKAYR